MGGLSSRGSGVNGLRRALFTIYVRLGVVLLGWYVIFQDDSITGLLEKRFLAKIVFCMLQCYYSGVY